jgi:hypothetical protein
MVASSPQPFEFGTHLFVVFVYLIKYTIEIIIGWYTRTQTYNRTCIGHDKITFGCLKTEVDRLCVLANDDTATRVVSASKKQVIRRSGRHELEEAPCTETSYTI